MNRKDEIILVTLELAAANGLSNVSMAQIAEKMGIRKPSLYNYFKAKEEIIAAMCQYLREKSKEQLSLADIDYTELKNFPLYCRISTRHLSIVFMGVSSVMQRDHIRSILIQFNNTRFLSIISPILSIYWETSLTFSHRSIRPSGSAIFFSFSARKKDNLI